MDDQSPDNKCICNHQCPMTEDHHWVNCPAHQYYAVYKTLIDSESASKIVALDAKVEKGPLRLKLDQRIHRQRVALRDNWMIIDRRWHYHHARPLQSRYLSLCIKLDRQVRELREENEQLKKGITDSVVPKDESPCFVNHVLTPEEDHSAREILAQLRNTDRLASQGMFHAIRVLTKAASVIDNLLSFFSVKKEESSMETLQRLGQEFDGRGETV